MSTDHENGGSAINRTIKQKNAAISILFPGWLSFPKTGLTYDTRTVGQKFISAHIGLLLSWRRDCRSGCLRWSEE